MASDRTAGVVRDERRCFFCSNSHIMEPERKCDCVCHKVAPTYDKLKAINAELEWTIPQLVALTDWERTVRLDEVERMPGGLSAGQPNNYKTCRIVELSRPAEKENK